MRVIRLFTARKLPPYIWGANWPLVYGVQLSLLFYGADYHLYFIQWTGDPLISPVAFYEDNDPQNCEKFK